MAEESKIEWCDSTFNPWIGCTAVSPACDHCYAEAMMDHRYGKVKWGPHGERQRTSVQNWNLPRRWQRQARAFYAQHGWRRRVFCASLADVFDNKAPAGAREDLWQLIRETPDLDWLLLTKRPQNIAKMLPEFWDEIRGHVWLGTSIENQDEVRRRLPALLTINPRPAIFFASAEPLLGPLDLTWFRKNDGGEMHPLSGTMTWSLKAGEPAQRRTSWALDWVIAGGESGPNARPSNPQWFRDLRNQCDEAGVAFLFKQHGEWLSTRDDTGQISYATMTMHEFPKGEALYRVGKKAAGRILDGKTHDGFPLPVRP